MRVSFGVVQGNEVTRRVANALFSACGKGKPLERSLKVFEAMELQGILRGIVAYSALVNARGRGNSQS